jgi:4-diphosphocytidyl-2-C-methyl-D-erythritol kinase
MPNSAAVRLRAHAKINLYLSIGPRRLDGYHDLETVFQEISLHDTLTVRSARNGLTLTCDDASLSSGADNLVVRALAAVQTRLRVRSGAVARLEKRIPVGAGLGGGSSDAAAALRAGLLLWGGARERRQALERRFDPAWLAVARRLGADVPFFLAGGRAFAEGAGEKLVPLPRPPKTWFVLVSPRVHVSTPDAYKSLDASRAKAAFTSAAANSFEPVVFRAYPAVRRAAQALARAGAQDVRMSGSGSALFGRVSDQRRAAAVARRFSRRFGAAMAVHTV